MAPREDFVWETDVDTAALNSPQDQLKASIFEGKLHVQVNDQQLHADLPEDAFTDDAHAKLENGKLHVRIGRRDPNGPAMQEKRMFNPDRHPVELDIALPAKLISKAKSPISADKTPAQQSVSEFNSDLYGDPTRAHKMPAVNMGSSIVTAMPVMMTEGGVVDTVSQGETVVKVPGSSDTVHLSGLTGGPGQELPSSEELADKLRDTAVHDTPPPGAKVLAGTKAHENEMKYDDRAVQPTAAAAATAGAPAGEDEHLLMATGQKGEKVRTDFTMNKVGMEYQELTAGDLYVDSESKTEPISSLKQPGADLCDLCACGPCQCDKMKHSGGGGNNPYELTPAETKRSGKPAIHHPHREVTGKNAHEAHDYRGHAKQVREDHARIGNKLGDYEGDVPEGVGDVDDEKYQQLPYTKHVGATHTGGRPLEFGGPGKRHVSDQAVGGPIKGGSKTTFTTMG